MHISTKWCLDFVKIEHVKYIFELTGWGKKLECTNLVLLELYKCPPSIYAYYKSTSGCVNFIAAIDFWNMWEGQVNKGK